MSGSFSSPLMAEMMGAPGSGVPTDISSVGWRFGASLFLRLTWDSTNLNRNIQNHTVKDLGWDALQMELGECE